jgi:hypothetical protein
MQNRPASSTDSTATRPSAAAIAARFFSRPASPASSSANLATSANIVNPSLPQNDTDANKSLRNFILMRRVQPATEIVQ